MGIHRNWGATDETDEWTTETFSTVVHTELNKLGELLSAPRSDSDRQTKMLTDAGFQASFPTARTRLFADSQIVVERATSKRRQTGDLAEFVFATTEAFQPFQDCQSSFKVIGIQLSAEYIDATCFVTLHGKRSDGRFEQNSYWKTRWTTGANKLRLQRIQILSLEEVYTRSPNGRPLFLEFTPVVFAEVPSYRRQLRYGQSHWQRRIEAFHGVLNQAQNGLSVGDVNGDGLDDVYVSQPGGLPNRLYLHLRDGRVRDVSAASGTDILDNTHSSLIIDFDNDGDQDLVLATAPALLLFANNGQARFTLKAAIDSVMDTYSMAAADYDLDGDLDVYTCGYFPAGADASALPVPVPYFDARNGASNHLLENRGHWQLVDATEQVGLGVDNRRFSYATSWVDFDKDGDQDLYVANDFGPDKLYRNERQSGQARFVDISEAAGIRQGAFGMSVAVADFDRNGFEDVYVANMFSSAGSRVTHQKQFRPSDSDQLRKKFQHLAAGNTLLSNLNGKTFRDVASVTGVTMGRWSWGSNFIDINNDGWQDLVVSNGYITGSDPDDL